MLVNEEPGAAGVAPAASSSAPPTSVDAVKSSDGSTQRLIGLIAGGAGIVALGAGAFFGLKAKSTYNDALAQCNPSKQCDQRGLDLGSDATSQATISTVAFVAGGALLAGGAVLYLTAPRGTAVSVGGTWNRGVAAVTVGGAF